MTATSHSVSLLMYHLTMFDQALRAALWSPWQQELLKNCKNWLSWWINIFHVNKHSPAIPCLISLFFFSTPDLKLKTNEFVYDGMLCFPLNPYHWHVVLFTVLPTPPRFGFCMHNFWISPIELHSAIDLAIHCSSFVTLRLIRSFKPAALSFFSEIMRRFRAGYISRFARCHVRNYSVEMQR